MVATSWFWNMLTAGYLIEEESRCQLMEVNAKWKTALGIVLHLEEESKVDWLVFLVWYAGCVAISQAERYHHALRHLLVRSHRASLTVMH